MNKYNEEPNNEEYGTDEALERSHHRWPLRCLEAFLAIVICGLFALGIQSAVAHRTPVRQFRVDYNAVFHQKTKPFNFYMD